MSNEIIPTQLELALTPQELNSRASNLLTQLHQYSFTNLPAIIARIVENESWKKLPTKFENFGQYALSQTVDGLGVDSNEKLWLLRCAMDANETHISEWSDVLLELEKMIKAMPLEERKTIPQKCSLENLAKVPGGKKITYHPNRSSGADKDIIRLAKKDHETVKKIAVGEITRKSALEKFGFKGNSTRTRLSRAKSDIRGLSESERNALFEWMKESGYL